MQCTVSLLRIYKIDNVGQSQTTHADVSAIVEYACMHTCNRLTVFTVEQIPTGSPSRGGDAAVYVFDVNQLSLTTPFNSVLVSVSVFMAISTVFHSISSPDNPPLSHSVLPVLFLPYWSFQLCISL